MKHLGTKRIETERLILRPHIVEDAEAMYKNWAHDPEVTKYLTWAVHESADSSRELLEEWVPQYKDERYYQWAIALKENEAEPIGGISVVSINDDVGSVHVGYCIGQRWWHQGIMTEALGAVIDFFFNEVGANRIESRHDPNNPHSGDVMKKCGMKYEGTMRQSDRNNQGICDSSWYAILKEDYSS